MRLIWSLLVPILFLAQAAHAGDSPLQKRVRQWSQLFDGLKGKGIENFIPQVPGGGKGGIHQWRTPDEKKHEIPPVPADAIPEIGKSAPLTFEWLNYRDAFEDRRSCGSVDAVYVTPPSMAEALTSLNKCLGSVTRTYSVQVTAVKGSGEILIVLSGMIPPGSTVAADLQHALAIRKNMLFERPARLQIIGQPGEARTSSLQHVVNLCDGGQAAKKIGSAVDFLSVYAGCLKRAKGIAITNVTAHPTEKLSVIVYSQDPLSTVSHMDGTITVKSRGRPVHIRVHAQREVLAEQQLGHAAYLDAAG